jgi:prepilin-type N-terminal cleavage/methylation domain-containing protein
MRGNGKGRSAAARRRAGREAGSTQGFTLLEMIVASTIMAIALVGLLAGISGTTHNAARLQDYDRAVQLGRARMDELMLDLHLPRDVQFTGSFDTRQTGGFEAGWRAKLTTFELPPVKVIGETALDRVELEVWWQSGQVTRTFTLDAYRPRVINFDDLKEPAK